MLKHKIENLVTILLFNFIFSNHETKSRDQSDSIFIFFHIFLNYQKIKKTRNVLFNIFFEGLLGIENCVYRFYIFNVQHLQPV